MTQEFELGNAKDSWSK